MSELQERGGALDAGCRVPSANPARTPIERAPECPRGSMHSERFACRLEPVVQPCGRLESLDTNGLGSLREQESASRCRDGRQQTGVKGM